MVDKYEGITDPVELYNKFKDEFYAYVVNKLPETEAAGCLIEDFRDYKFDCVRMVIDKEVDDAADILMINAHHGLEDEVDQLRYKTWKDLDNIYMEFYDKYFELLELNLQ